ncbi:hypothetical protein BH11ACT6_BH11ACT6_29350 [soil metagenome]
MRLPWQAPALYPVTRDKPFEVGAETAHRAALDFHTRVENRKELRPVVIIEPRPDHRPENSLLQLDHTPVVNQPRPVQPDVLQHSPVMGHQ